MSNMRIIYSANTSLKVEFSFDLSLERCDSSRTLLAFACSLGFQEYFILVFMYRKRQYTTHLIYLYLKMRKYISLSHKQAFSD